MDLSRPLRPVRALSLRPWAGSRLGPGVGEVWVAGPSSVVADEHGTESTLDEIAAATGEALVGTAGMASLGARFPLLAKLIDAAEWLSLQVHPDDALARRLYGDGAIGKDEAWLILDVDPATRLVTGPASGREADSLLAAIAAGTMGLDACDVHTPMPGETLNVRAGTIHAIGPGAFVYELEQPSDYTFRISDWGRPATPGRGLHPDEARQAVVPGQHATRVGAGWRLDGGVLNERHLRLELLAGRSGLRSPGLRSPDLVTAVRGPVTLRGAGWTERLKPLDTVVVPAAVAAYEVDPGQGAVAVVGSLPA